MTDKEGMKHLRVSFKAQKFCHTSTLFCRCWVEFRNNKNHFREVCIHVSIQIVRTAMQNGFWQVNRRNIKLITYSKIQFHQFYPTQENGNHYTLQHCITWYRYNRFWLRQWKLLTVKWLSFYLLHWTDLHSWNRQCPKMPSLTTPPKSQKPCITIFTITNNNKTWTCTTLQHVYKCCLPCPSKQVRDVRYAVLWWSWKNNTVTKIFNS